MTLYYFTFIVYLILVFSLQTLNNSFIDLRAVRKGYKLCQLHGVSDVFELMHMYSSIYKTHTHTHTHTHMQMDKMDGYMD